MDTHPAGCTHFFLFFDGETSCERRCSSVLREWDACGPRGEGKRGRRISSHGTCDSMDELAERTVFCVVRAGNVRGNGASGTEGVLGSYISRESKCTKGIVSAIWMV